MTAVNSSILPILATIQLFVLFAIETLLRKTITYVSVLNYVSVLKCTVSITQQVNSNKDVA